jgi:hypothetical protein
MAIKVIKQCSDEKVEVYYEQILKPTNCLQHKVNNWLVDNFFPSQVGPLLANRNYKSETRHLICRNPTLAKCGGEAQHLERVGIWSPPGLLNV